MSEILNKLNALSGVKASIILLNQKPLMSTIRKDQLIYVKIGQQAFGHIFKKAVRYNPQYDEAQLQMGDQRLLSLLLENGGLYLALLDSSASVQKAQRVLRESRPVLNKVIARALQKAAQ
jgi:hypothetical protein